MVLCTVAGVLPEPDAVVAADFTGPPSAIAGANTISNDSESAKKRPDSVRLDIVNMLWPNQPFLQIIATLRLLACEGGTAYEEDLFWSAAGDRGFAVTIAQ